MEFVKLKNIITRNKGTLLSKDKIIDGTGAYKFFISGKDTYTSDSYSYDGEYVIIGDGGNVGPDLVHYYDGKCDGTNHTHFIKSKDDSKYLNKFLYYYIIYKFLNMNLGRGICIQNIRVSDFENIDVPVISIDMQKRIIEECDNATTSSSKLMESILLLKNMIDSLIPLRLNELFKELVDNN